MRPLRTVDGYGCRLFAQDGDDLGLIEHPRDNLGARDCVLYTSGRLPVVIDYLQAVPGAPLARWRSSSMIGALRVE